MKFDIMTQMRDAKLKNNDYTGYLLSGISLHLEDISQPGVVFSIRRDK